MDVEIANVESTSFGVQEILLQFAHFFVGATFAVDSLFVETSSFNFLAAVNQQRWHKGTSVGSNKVPDFQEGKTTSAEGFGCVVGNTRQTELGMTRGVTGGEAIVASEVIGAEANGLAAWDAINALEVFLLC